MVSWCTRKSLLRLPRSFAPPNPFWSNRFTEAGRGDCSIRCVFAGPSMHVGAKRPAVLASSRKLQRPNGAGPFKWQ
jgi:hypothetical protein